MIYYRYGVYKERQNQKRKDGALRKYARNKSFLKRKKQKSKNKKIPVDIYPIWVYYMEAREGRRKAMPGETHLHKTKERSDEEYQRLMHRLNRIEGQVRGIKGMLEKSAYCVDILTQSAAVSAAINAFNRELLASHIRSCVAQDIRQGRDETIDELVAMLQKLMK
jgi:DNA-binding FrmR family transcriptional regulator